MAGRAGRGSSGARSGGSGGRSASRRAEALKRIGWRVAVAGALAALLFFAVEGGEYSTRDLLARRARHAELETRVASLAAEVDSLYRELEAIRSDPVVLERVAREEHSMVRGPRELLYRFVEPSSDSDSAPDAGVDSTRDREAERPFSP